MTPKNVKAYVYQIKLNLPPEFKLKEVFSKDNLTDLRVNVEKIGDDSIPYLLLVDNSKDSFLCGRFMKLRKFTPRRLNCETKEEQEVTLKKAENLEEISHFIWNERDQIMLGEYNFFAVRIFTAALTEYLNSLFRRRFHIEIKAEVPPKLRPGTLEALEKDPTLIKKIDFRVVQDDFAEVVKQLRWGIFKTLKRGRKGYEHYLRVSISSHWNEGVFDKGEVIRFAEEVQDEDKVRGLKVTTGENVYDLFKDNYWYCTVPCIIDGGNIKQSEDFYALAKKEYGKEIENIKKAIEGG